MSAPHFLDQAAAFIAEAVSSPLQIFALIAAVSACGLTVSSSFVKTMVPLRFFAVGSSLGFLIYGVVHPSPIMALLHGTLLPINVFRLREMARLTRQVHAASLSADTSGVWMKPYMKSRRCPAGTVLFRQGDPAEHLFLLASGRVEFVEIGESTGPGRMFGEIAFFAPGNRRTLTARCSEDSVVLSVDQGTVRQLYFQNPSFGFELVGLVAGRLSADVVRLQGQLRERDNAA